MYLTRLMLNRSRAAVLWVANPYRVHQRLMMGCDEDPRLLFRIEETERGVQILAQSTRAPDWQKAFGDFPVLLHPPEEKAFDPRLLEGARYRFRLLANPTVKVTVEKEGEESRKTRRGLIKEKDQLEWIKRKLEAAGAEVLGCMTVPRGLQHSHKGGNEGSQTHLAVLFEGVLAVQDAMKLKTALQDGIGSAKGYGFGLLSLARV